MICPICMLAHCSILSILYSILFHNSNELTTIKKKRSSKFAQTKGLKQQQHTSQQLYYTKRRTNTMYGYMFSLYGEMDNALQKTNPQSILM